MHFIFDQERLYRLLTEFGPEAYAQAKPFPHAIFDDFLPDSVLRCAIEDFSEVHMSLALYSYSNGRPVHEKESSHSTLFLKDSSVARWRGIAKSRFNKIKKAILRGD